MKEHALKAISEASLLLDVSKNKCSHEEFERIRLGVGGVIGRIQSDLLDLVYAQYPDLDDLK